MGEEPPGTAVLVMAAWARGMSCIDLVKFESANNFAWFKNI